MSFKPVELQIAVPRVTEAAKLHQEALHRPVQDQQMLAAMNVKHSREEAQRSAEVEETAESAIRDDGRRGRSNHGSGESGRRETEDKQAEHPFKGKRIDLSL
ncbi:hypothetical protein [Paenibacillus glufosinatiresistens]|uniref:hypothetical protein n=1 Tax=Paenibacillus glufosinatiresistens TaxID=3070657 RepID=UPI00286EA02E|nr:hypothetical protein [Paenibacillus sp. YX.27]